MQTSAATSRAIRCLFQHRREDLHVARDGRRVEGREAKARFKLKGGMTPTNSQKARYLRSLRAANLKARPYLAIKLGPRVPPASRQAGLLLDLEAGQEMWEGSVALKIPPSDSALRRDAALA